jgi:hypothetical protein
MHAVGFSQTFRKLYALNILMRLRIRVQSFIIESFTCISTSSDEIKGLIIITHYY